MNEQLGITQLQFFEAHQQVMDKMQELHRSQTLRTEALAKELTQYTLAIVPQVATHTEKLHAQESRLRDAEEDLKDVTKKSAFISGVGAILAIAVGLLPLPWKH